ncbi:MAG TPA: hypothetical protein VI653_25470 [Steroidobacteraceae bacterium]
MIQDKAESQEDTLPQHPTAESAPRRREWHAPEGQIVDVAVATRATPGLGADLNACHS